jgi:hypothetical protein
MRSSFTAPLMRLQGAGHRRWMHTPSYRWTAQACIVRPARIMQRSAWRTCAAMQNGTCIDNHTQHTRREDAAKRSRIHTKNWKVTQQPSSYTTPRIAQSHKHIYTLVHYGRVTCTHVLPYTHGQSVVSTIVHSFKELWKVRTLKKWSRRDRIRRT